MIFRWALLLFLSGSMEAQFNTKTTIALFSADAVVRTLDAQSTLRNLNNPCNCFTEAGIGFKSPIKQYSYSLGYVAAEYGVSYLLHRAHHDRLAKLIPAIDIAYDGRAVAHNYTLSPPSRAGFRKLN